MRVGRRVVSPARAGAYGQVSYGYDASGNITQFESGGTNLYYQDAAHKHAITHVGGTTSQYQKYWYDPNGNVTRRISNTLDITLSYDYENHVAGISGSVSYSYLYDGDGKLVKMTIAGTTTALVGNWYEWTNNAAKVYYYAGSTRLAVRDAGGLYYLLSDHLGSTAVTTDGASQAELRYMAFGMARLKSGTQKTPYRYTGQRVEGALDIYYYGARWYDPVVGRFLQPDTIVPNPGNPQSLNRYSYVLNAPLRYADPTGHKEACGTTGVDCDAQEEQAPSVRTAVAQINTLVTVQWLLQQGPETASLGPENALTYYVQKYWAPSLRARWRTKGHPLGTWVRAPTLDDRSGQARQAAVALFFRVQVLETPRAILEALLYGATGADLIGGTVGSLDEFMYELAPDRPGWAKVTATNSMSWDSANRAPGTDRGMILTSKDRDQPYTTLRLPTASWQVPYPSTWGETLTVMPFGGTCVQSFSWWEPVYVELY